MKAIFLDRDGTIIIDKHYLADPKDIEYLPHTQEALILLAKQGFHFFLVTNQSGIGRGYFTENQMHQVHAQIKQDLKHWGTPLQDIAFCPHLPANNCTCRKPKPGMLLSLIQKWSINPGQSFMIGDKPLDTQAGLAAGVKSYLLSKERDLLKLTQRLF